MLGVALFKGLPAAEIRRLVAIGTRRRFARDEVVFHRGDPADALHVVVRGHFAARLETPLGDTVTMAVHGPGDAFGELALLDTGRSRSTTVASLAAGETHAIHRIDFDRLRREFPEVNDLLARLLAQRLRRTSELLAEALFLSAETRVLRRLTELVALYREGPPPTVVPLSQSELAGLAGTSRATVNRVLRAEAKRGILELRRGHVTVIDPVALAARDAGHRRGLDVEV